MILPMILLLCTLYMKCAGTVQLYKQGRYYNFKLGERLALKLKIWMTNGFWHEIPLRVTGFFGSVLPPLTVTDNFRIRLMLSVCRRLPMGSAVLLCLFLMLLVLLLLLLMLVVCWSGRVVRRTGRAGERLPALPSSEVSDLADTFLQSHAFENNFFYPQTFERTFFLGLSNFLILNLVN